MACCTITVLAELPGLNEIIALSKDHFGAYSKAKREYTRLVAWHSHAATRFEGRVKISCIWYCKDKRKDPDNIAAGLKFILDGLVLSGVIKNDGWKQVGGISHSFDIDKRNPRVEVVIEEMAESA